MELRPLSPSPGRSTRPVSVPSRSSTHMRPYNDSHCGTSVHTEECLVGNTVAVSVFGPDTPVSLLRRRYKNVFPVDHT